MSITLIRISLLAVPRQYCKVSQLVFVCSRLGLVELPIPPLPPLPLAWGSLGDAQHQHLAHHSLCSSSDSDVTSKHHQHGHSGSTLHTVFYPPTDPSLLSMDCLVSLSHIAQVDNSILDRQKLPQGLGQLQIGCNSPDCMLEIGCFSIRPVASCKSGPAATGRGQAGRAERRASMPQQCHGMPLPCQCRGLPQHF